MKNFIRKKENFICKNCGQNVTGNGYTDHCPYCLWGRHMDDEIPGDRASDCHGLMEPIRAEVLGDIFKITYKCLDCKHVFRVKSTKEDNIEILKCLINN